MSSVFVQAVTKIILKLRHFSDPTHTKFFIENSLRKFKYFCLSFCDVDYFPLQSPMGATFPNQIYQTCRLWWAVT